MTPRQLIKQYRRNGIALTSTGLTCHIEMKGVNIVRPIQTDENFTKAQFVTDGYIMEVTAWKKPAIDNKHKRKEASRVQGFEYRA